MPFVDLHSKADHASIFYTTNAPFSYVSGFDPEKPTVVILHPAFLDISWIDLQLGDSRLDSNYNIIAFDFRSSGKSTCRLSGRHDSWVDAADLAFCFQKLHLPPSHILALEGSAIYCGIRFAILFPEMCLSLTLVNVPAPMETKWIYKNVDELIHNVCFAEDVDSFEQAAFDFVDFMFGPRADPDLVDDVVLYWGMVHPPIDRARLAETTNVYINRTPLTAEAYALITQPVLIIQGEKNELCPMRYAEKLAAQMTGIKGGVKVSPVKGAATMIAVTPEHAWNVNTIFVDFLSRLPRHRSDLNPPEISIQERMEIALQKLFQITGGADPESLDPMCSLSFASLGPDIAKAQTDLLRRYLKDADHAFDPASIEGWTLRRYSQRKANKEDGLMRGINSSSSLVVPPPYRVKHDERPMKSSLRPSEVHAEIPAGKSIFYPLSSIR